MTESLANQYRTAQLRFEKANKAFLEADAELEREKKLNECMFAEFTRLADGESQTEKKTNALASEDWRTCIHKYNTHYMRKNLAKAEYMGAETNLDRIRSTMSLEKTLIDKGIYQPSNPNNNAQM